MPATPDQIRSVIEQYVKAWTTNDRELLLSLFAEDAVWEDPVGAPPFVGHEGVGRFWDFAHQDASRQMVPRPEQIIACGNEGILRFVMQVRIPDQNQGLDLHVVDHFVLNDAGRIQTARAFWDEQCAQCPPGMDMFAPDIDDAYES